MRKKENNEVEVKKYPSELNSRAIACRIPFEAWTRINSECIANGITINDWLLDKIYPNGQFIGDLRALNSNNGIEDRLNEICLYRNDFYDWIIEKHCDGNCDNAVPDYVKGFWEKAIRLTTPIEKLRGGIVTNETEGITIDKMIHHLWFDYTQIESGKIAYANTTDMSIQANILLSHTKWSHKEQSEYRKELKRLLDELNEAVEENNDFDVDDTLYNKQG